MNFEIEKEFAIRSILKNDTDIEFLQSVIQNTSKADIEAYISERIDYSYIINFAHNLLQRNPTDQERKVFSKMLLYLNEDSTVQAYAEICKYLND